jgi:hypothetical protein
MKTFRIEFDEITTHVGTIQANSIDEAKEKINDIDIFFNADIEPIVGETKIQFIKEIKDESKTFKN